MFSVLEDGEGTSDSPAPPPPPQPIEAVELDGLVVLKITKHCQQALPAFVTGQLLGLDIGSTLEVTNSFPFPTAERGEADEDSAEYQMEMMRAARAR